MTTSSPGDDGAVVRASRPNRDAWARRGRWAVAAMWVLAALPALWQLGLLLYAVSARVAYPYDLEWMEGGMLTHADRLAAGKPLYAAPSIDFIPYLYTPLYPAVLAGLGQVFGLSYGLGRAVSIVSLLGLVALMVRTIRREADSADRVPAAAGAALAAGLLAATYPWLEGWYDLVRGDTLFLTMVVGGLMLVRGAARSGARGGHGHAAVAALLLGSSFLCKQTGVLYVALGGALLLFRRWRLLPVYVAVSGLVGLGSTALFNHASAGWFWTYIYEIHQAHDFSTDRFYKSFSNILWKFPAMTMVIALALLAVAAAALVRRALPRSAAGVLMWSPVFAVSCLVGALGWGTQWAHFNAYMPAMATGALACGAALPALAGALAMLVPGRGSWLSRALPAAVALVLAMQLAMAHWNPRRFIPTDRDRAAGDALIDRLRGLRAGGDSDIYVPFHPWYARLAGQEQTYTHRMGILDVTYGGKWHVEGLHEALSQARFAAVVLDNRPPGSELPGLRQGYRLDDKLPATLAPRLYTGAKVVPASIWVPIASPVPAGATVLFDFEDGASFAERGWQSEGTAFGGRPVARALPGQGDVLGYRGRYFVNSMHGGDRSVGRLASRPFVISGPRLGFRLSGGMDPGLRVELHTGGQAVRTAGNERASERMRAHEWDVSELMGQQATLVLIDEVPGSWGHLCVDDFVMWER